MIDESSGLRLNCAGGGGGGGGNIRYGGGNGLVGTGLSTASPSNGSPGQAGGASQYEGFIGGGGGGGGGGGCPGGLGGEGGNGSTGPTPGAGDGSGGSGGGGYSAVGYPVTTGVADPGNGSVIITFSYALTITESGQLPTGFRGEAYSFQLRAAGGTAPYHWKKTSILPRGLKLSSSGVLSGTPSTKLAPGTYSFSVQVADHTKKVHQTATQTFTLPLV